jgi:hypothetical protein
MRDYFYFSLVLDFYLPCKSAVYWPLNGPSIMNGHARVETHYARGHASDL